MDGTNEKFKLMKPMCFNGKFYHVDSKTDLSLQGEEEEEIHYVHSASKGL